MPSSGWWLAENSGFQVPSNMALMQQIAEGVGSGGGGTGMMDRRPGTSDSTSQGEGVRGGGWDSTSQGEGGGGEAGAGQGGGGGEGRMRVGGGGELPLSGDLCELDLGELNLGELDLCHGDSLPRWLTATVTFHQDG